jgi:NAD-dependent protein deacetylase/lipoamidase
MAVLDNKSLEIFSSAKSIVFFTGAGVSAESGIPTFRGNDGIWKKLKPEELANFDSFLRNPEMVWEWYKHRKHIVHEAKPNLAHATISDFQSIFPNVKVITQNIDNLHRRAGSKSVYELHGNIERNYCIKCKTFYNDDIVFSDTAPKCRCGGLIRPDVVWFGEYLPSDEFRGGENAAKKADIFIIVGTSAIVYPAASIIYIAKDNGAYIIEINLESTQITSLADQSFFGKAGEILPNIYKEIMDSKLKT